MEQITIKEVAKLCGVGVSTVSRAINNHPDINPETKQKILDVIREYNYVPNNSARNLKRADSNTIAVVIKEISNSYWGVMLHVLEREVRDRKYCLVLQNVADDEDEVELALQLEKEKKVKGIIFLGGMYNYDESRLRMLRVPYVISGSGKTVPEDTGTYPKSALVTTDTEIESQSMVDYLCSCRTDNSFLKWFVYCNFYLCLFIFIQERNKIKKFCMIYSLFLSVYLNLIQL